MSFRGYLSYSQMSLLEQSEELYCMVYFEDRKLSPNQGQIFGSKVADSLQSGDIVGDLDTDVVIAALPKLELMDKTFEAVLNMGEIKVPVLAKIDSASRDLLSIIEYKTGVTSWNHKKVDECDQITFYCMVCQALTGIIPNNVRLIYAPCVKGEENQNHFTGDIMIFDTKRTRTDVLKMKIRAKNAWQKINELASGYII